MVPVGGEVVHTYATAADLPATGDTTRLYCLSDTGRFFRWVDATTKYVETGAPSAGGPTWTTVPASRTASGVAGSLAYDASYLYVATANSTWRRAALTWTDDQYFANVRALLHFDGAATDTATTGGTWSGSVAYSTAVKKFGTYSLSPSGSWLSRVTTAFNYGTGDFTAEAWVYPTSSSGIYGIYGTSAGSGAVAKFVLHLDSLVPKAHLSNLSQTNSWLSATSSVAVNSWSHIALVRSSGTCAWYINGARTATVSEAANITFASNVATYIGYGGESYFQSFAGYIDDLRLTAGVARYSGASLTVPTAAFPDS